MTSGKSQTEKPNWRKFWKGWKEQMMSSPLSFCICKSKVYKCEIQSYKLTLKANHIKCILVSSIAISKKASRRGSWLLPAGLPFSHRHRARHTHTGVRYATVLELRHDYYETLLELRVVQTEPYKKCSILKQGSKLCSYNHNNNP